MKNKLIFKYIVYIVGFSLFAVAAHAETSLNEIRVVGWVERACICPEGLLLKAKLDTGARHSSLHATDIVRFKKNDSVWVRFTVQGVNKKKTVLERPLLRTAKIKVRNGKNDERPVVALTVALGDRKRTTEVNLVDRSKFIYDFLIGRSFLKGFFAIDPSARYTVISKCKAFSTRFGDAPCEKK